MRYEKIDNEKHLRKYTKRIFNFFPFFKMIEISKILSECYKDHFIKKFKIGTKPSSVESQELTSFEQGNLDNAKYIKI